jgi:hypothetical protein
MTPSTRRSFLTASALGVTAVALPAAGAHASPGPLGTDGGSSVALASYVFGGSGHLEVDSTSDPATGLWLGTQDFTIECWFRLNRSSRVADEVQHLVFLDYAGVDGFGYVPLSLHLVVGSGNSVAVRADFGTVQRGRGATLDDGWHHVAAMRSTASGMTTLSVLVDGTEQFDTQTSSINLRDLRAPRTPLAVGAGFNYFASDAVANRFSGAISNVRIVRGLALYDIAVDGSGFRTYVPDGLPLERRSGSGITTPFLLLGTDLSADAGDTARAITVIGSGVTLSTTDVPAT